MLVVVQRGHCFRTTGATGAPGEQAFTKAAADRVAFHVRTLGHQVRIINADVTPALYLGDLFVALHYDSSSNPSARGASVGYKTTAGRRFAEAWKRHYVAQGWTGGFRDDNYTPALVGYYGVRRAVEAGTTRAFIAEAGFHSNPQDAALLAAPEGPDRVGRSVAAAVAELVGGKAPATVQEEDDMALFEKREDFIAAVREAVGAEFTEVGDPTRTAILELSRRGSLHGDDQLVIPDDFAQGGLVYFTDFKTKVSFKQGSQRHNQIKADLAAQGLSTAARRIPQAVLDAIEDVVDQDPPEPAPTG